MKIILEHELPEHQAEELFLLLIEIKDLLIERRSNGEQASPEEPEDQSTGELFLNTRRTAATHPRVLLISPLPRR